MATELAPIEPAPPPAPTAPVDLLQEFFRSHSPGTVRGYRNDLRAFARATGLETPAAAVELFLGLDAGRAHAAALSYRNGLLESGLSTATVARRLAALRSVVKLARQLGRVTWSLEVGAVRIEPREDRRGPGREDRRKLFRSMKAGDRPRDKRDRAIVALLFGLGLRRNEVCTLRLEDIDWVTGTVRVLRKGRRERLTLSFPAKVAAALGSWVDARGRHAGPLFVRTDRKGATEPLSGDSVARMLARHALAAGVSVPVRPHGLRHSAITKLAERRKTTRELQAFSGHAKPEHLARYDDTKDAAQRAGAKEVSDEL